MALQFTSPLPPSLDARRDVKIVTEDRFLA